MPGSLSSREAKIRRKKQLIDCQSTGGQVEVYTGDTGKDELVSELGEFLRERCGRADILVNCAAEPAGQGVDPTVEEVTYDQLERQMNVKVMGYLRAAQSVIPLMRENAFGRIISISGMGARKAGDTVGSIRNISVVALGKNLAEDLQGTGITSVILHPGYTKTDKVEAMISRRSKEEDRDEGEIEAELAGGNLSGFLPTPADVAALTCFVASFPAQSTAMSLHVPVVQNSDLHLIAFLKSGAPTRTTYDRFDPRNLLAAMNQEEKIAQLLCVSITDLLTDGQFDRGKAEKQLGGGVGQIARAAGWSHKPQGRPWSSFAKFKITPGKKPGLACRQSSMKRPTTDSGLRCHCLSAGDRSGVYLGCRARRRDARCDPERSKITRGAFSAESSP